MNRLSTDPRPPINQGIDQNHPTVLLHTAIFNGALSTITEGMQTVGLMVNPYGNSPLSGYLGIWSPTSNPIRVQITNDIGAIPIDYSYTPEAGRNLVPLLGLIPAALNHLTVTIPGVGTASGEIITAPLPPTDAELGPDQFREGFPTYEVTVPAANLPDTVNELYFTAFGGRYNVGVDPTGTVRWYTTRALPAWNFERFANSHFYSTSGEFDTNRQIFEFDMIGRVYSVYILDNICHHSLYEMPNGNILLPSEYTGTTVEDGLSIIDINTGLEVAYYDLRNVLDTDRNPIPIDPLRPLDWLHTNQSIYNATNNLLISSGRHQGVFGINYDTSELVFVLASHVDWGEDFSKYLLTPVNDSGTPIYDLSNADDIERADKEFWQWGQHAVLEVPNSSEGIVEFFLLDNGNYRSRDVTRALLPNDNYSKLVHYKVDLNNMTVQKIFDYGETEVGSRGYSSFVANGEFLENGNYLVNFGGNIFDENERVRTLDPGYSDIDDPLMGVLAQGKVLIQEIDPATKTPVVEFSCPSGAFKNREEYGDEYHVDLFSFRTRKWSLLP